MKVDKVTYLKVLKLIERLRWTWQDGSPGAPAVDRDKPYYTSDIEADVLTILGEIPEGNSWSDRQRSQANALHLMTAGVLRNLATTTIELLAKMEGKLLIVSDKRGKPK